MTNDDYQSFLAFLQWALVIAEYEVLKEAQWQVRVAAADEHIARRDAEKTRFKSHYYGFPIGPETNYPQELALYEKESDADKNLHRAVKLGEAHYFNCARTVDVWRDPFRFKHAVFEKQF